MTQIKLIRTDHFCRCSDPCESVASVRSVYHYL